MAIDDESPPLRVNTRGGAMVTFSFCSALFLPFSGGCSVPRRFAGLVLMAAPDRMRQGGGECGGAENQRWPPWLKPLLGTSFFGQCKLHADAHKSECNMYCLDCMNGALCSQCLAYHREHHAIQVSSHSLPSDWSCRRRALSPPREKRRQLPSKGASLGLSSFAY